MNAPAMIAALIAAAGAACSARTPPGPDPQVEVSHLPPEGGRVVSMRIHRATGVVTATLSNGVVVHHKRLAAESVVVAIGVAGGPMLETDSTRGLSALASVAWRAPATRSTTGDDLAAEIESAGIETSAFESEDAILMQLVAPPDAVDRAMAIAADLLGQPHIEEPALEDRRSKLIGALSRMDRGPKRVLSEAIRARFFPDGDPRLARLTPDDVADRSSAEAQAWLDEAILGPVEVAIVGDIDLTRALSEASRTLGALPHRAVSSTGIYAPVRTVVPWPVESGLRLDLVCPDPDTAVAVVGCVGADVRDLEMHRAARIISRALGRRIKGALAAGRDGDGTTLDVRELSVESLPAASYPGTGLLLAVAVVEPGDHAKALELLKGEFDRAVAEGFSEQEVREIADEFAAAADGAEQQAGYWAGVLCLSQLRGMSPDAALKGGDMYRSLDAERVNGILRALAAPGRRIEGVVRPPGPAGQTSPDDKAAW